MAAMNCDPVREQPNLVRDAERHRLEEQNSCLFLARRRLVQVSRKYLIAASLVMSHKACVLEGSFA